MGDFLDHHLNDVQRIAFVRLLTPCIRIEGFEVPAEWLKREWGVDVRVFSELSAFKRDGTIAKAGEAFQTVILFSSSLGFAERRVFACFARWRTQWTQALVDYEVFAIVDRQRQLLEKQRIIEKERRKAAEAEEEHKRVREQLAKWYFKQHGQRIDSFRIGQKVATLDDGLVWCIIKKDVLHVEVGWEAAIRMLPNDTVVIKTSKDDLKRFKVSMSR